MSTPPAGAADERAAYARVEAALRRDPLRPAPPSLHPAVMRRVRALAAPRFRPGWLDLALSGFFALMLGVGLLGWQWLAGESLLARRLAQELTLLAQAGNLLQWAGMAAGALVVMLFALALLAWALTRPRLAGGH